MAPIAGQPVIRARTSTPEHEWLDFSQIGLTLMGWLDFNTPAERWHVMAIWRHRDGSDWYARDAGDRSETPFERFGFLEGLEFLDWEAVRYDLTFAIRRELVTPEEAVTFLEHVATNLKEHTAHDTPSL